MLLSSHLSVSATHIIPFSLSQPPCVGQRTIRTGNTIQICRHISWGNYCTCYQVHNRLKQLLLC